jgi:ATP-dependent Zn protease
MKIVFLILIVCLINNCKLSSAKEQLLLLKRQSQIILLNGLVLNECSLFNNNNNNNTINQWSWSKDGELIKIHNENDDKSNRFEIINTQESSYLKIKNVAYNDSGSYVCDLNGQYSIQFNLNVITNNIVFWMFAASFSFVILISILVFILERKQDQNKRKSIVL